MGHTFTKLLVHCVFSTKDRRPFLTPDVRKRLFKYIGGILSGRDIELCAAGGTENHVHLLLGIPATGSVADAMRLVKANSSRWLRETFVALADFGWQTGYAAFSVSCSARDDVIRYIGNQEEHHRRRSFEDEFREFLARHEFAFDERYVWD